VDAEKGRAEKRRNIMDAVEKRLDGLESAALLPKNGDPNGDPKEAAPKPAKRRRLARAQGFFRL
jgi:hypothetical protein